MDMFRAAIDGIEIRLPVPIPTFRGGLASAEIMDAIRASAAGGGALQKVGAMNQASVRDATPWASERLS
jgi:hypothetical protein